MTERDRRRHARQARAWAANGNVFIYFIAGAKVRNPAAAQSPAVRPAAAHASTEGAANNAVPARFSTRLEHMDTVRLHPRTLDTAKFAELDLAERELCSHCAGMDPDDEPERCWQVTG